MIETPHLVSLCFDEHGMQSCMYVDGPDLLALGYTRTMAGFLLLHPRPRRIAMIGLGGGSLAKYCYRHLPDARITSIEINPDVIALRDRFRIPPDDARFTVLCADGARYVAEAGEACADVLIVDGFDAGGLPLALGTRQFYADCRRHLADGGVLAVNLLVDDPRVADCLAALRDAGIRMGVLGDGVIRAVVHYMIDDDAISRTVDAVRAIVLPFAPALAPAAASQAQ